MALFENFLIQRFAYKSKRPFSKLIIGIAIAGIALGLSVMIGSITIMNGFQSTIKDKVRGFSGDLQVSLFSLNESPENEPFILDRGDLRKMRALPGVVDVSGFATKAGILTFKGNIEGVVLKGLSTESQTRFFQEKLIQGNTLVLSPDSICSDILVPKVIARLLNIHVGDKILLYFIQEPLRKRKLTVKGIYDLGMDELDKVYVIGDLRLIQRLNDWTKGQIGGLEVNIQDSKKTDWTKSEVNKILPIRLKVFTVGQVYPQLFDWLSLTEVNVRVILVLMLLVGGINMISALLIMILERTSTIGILKALGADNGQISRIFLGIALFLISIGIFLGDLLGIGFCIFQEKTHFIKLNQEVYYMAYVPVQFSWLSILALNLGTFLVCLMMILGPSVLVGRINPVKAIRFR
jgi:lipoprotein-releasing system permease protein